ncbi:MAG TPA: hypothetical protein VGB04_08505 [Allosphingosinicella sp.]|jgi:hypothetical protein
MSPRNVLVALLFAAAAPAAAADIHAPIVILSDEDGRGINIGLQEDAREAFEPAAYSGAQIADEFKRLCLDTAFAPEAFAAAGAQSPWRLAPGTIALKPAGKIPGWEQPVLQSGSARVSLWLGDDGALRKRPLMIRSRGALVMSGYGPYKARGKQCNLDLKLSGFTADAFVARMNENLGAQPAKLVSKGSFADGHWLLSAAAGGTIRVTFDAVDLKKSEQLLHVVAQTVTEPAK